MSFVEGSSFLNGHSIIFEQGCRGPSKFVSVPRIEPGNSQNILVVPPKFRENAGVRPRRVIVAEFVQQVRDEGLKAARLNRMTSGLAEG